MKKTSIFFLVLFLSYVLFAVAADDDEEVVPTSMTVHKTDLEKPISGCADPFRTGKVKIFSNSGDFSQGSFSPNGKYHFSINKEGSLSVYDLKSKKEKLLKNPSGSKFNMMYVDKKSNRLFISSEGKDGYIVDLSLDKFEFVKMKGPVNFSYYLGGPWVALSDEDKENSVYDLRDNTIKVFKQNDKDSENYAFSNDGKFHVGTYNDGTPAVFYDLEKKESIPIPGTEDYVEVSVSGNSKKILFSGNKGKPIKLYDVDTKTMSSLPNTEEYGETDISFSGKYIWAQDKRALIKLETGEVLNKDSDFVYGKFSQEKDVAYLTKLDKSLSSWDLDRASSAVKLADNFGIVGVPYPHAPQLLGLYENISTFSLYDIETQKKVSMPGGAIAGFPDMTRDAQFSNAVFPENSILLQNTEYCFRDINYLEFSKLTPEQSLKIEKVKNNLCAEEFNSSHWDKEIGDPQNTHINQEQIEKLMLRFQKPGSIANSKDMEILLTLLKNEENSHHKDLTFVLQNIMSTSYLLYEDVLGRFPHLQNAMTPSKVAAPCRSDKENEIIKKEFADYRKYGLVTGYRTEYKTLSPAGMITPLKDLYTFKNDTEKDDESDLVATAIADSASNSTGIGNIFHSKLYKFAKVYTDRLFGLPTHDKVDVTLVRKEDEDEIVPYVMSTKPIEGEGNVATPYGIYYKKLDGVRLNKDHQGNDVDFGELKNITFKTDGKTYNANLLGEYLKPGNVKDYKKTAPPYEKLWKDNQLHGVVIAGVNLDKSAEQVMNNYLNYYQQNGFEFDTAKEIPDTYSWMKQSVSEGKMDYLIKEAHSDGDEKNLFRLYKKMKVKTGKRTFVENGVTKTESVDLLYPVDKNSKDRGQLIANQEFGRWIRNREEKGLSPIVYFNTSCWSVKKAAHEMSAAASPYLVNIPATTTVHTFSNTDTNVEQVLFTQFRNGKNYDEIRKELEKKSRSFKMGQDDHFIFPDESDYEKSVLSGIRLPVDATVLLKDQSGTVIDIDNE